MAAIKITLSPEDRASNTYNSNALWNGHTTNEREQMRRCADMLEAELKRCGFEVKNQQGPSMKERVAEANAWPSDMHIALHTNGFNGKVSGTRVHCYPSDKSRRIGKLIQDRIGPLSPGNPDFLVESSNLYELKNTKMVAVLPEYGFHDNAVEAQWLVDNMPTIARETAMAVCAYFGVAYIPEPTQTPPAATETPSAGIGNTCMVELPVLLNGCTGTQVVLSLQRLLINRGFSCGFRGADGDFGTKTENAVKQFQQKAALPVTGKVDGDTWSAIITRKQLS